MTCAESNKHHRHTSFRLGGAHYLCSFHPILEISYYCEVLYIVGVDHLIARFRHLGYYMHVRREGGDNEAIPQNTRHV